MGNHYYTKNDKTLESNPKQIEFRVNGGMLKFTTDIGVFSRDRVDFGTVLMLDTFIPRDDSKIIDVGCGYGVIGITLAYTNDTISVTMIDVNDRSVKLAKMNAEYNNVKNVDVIESDLFDNVELENVDYVLSNPPIRAGKSVVFKIIEESYERLSVGGELWFVIQKKQGASSSEKKMKELFNDVEIVASKKGYQIIKAIK